MDGNFSVTMGEVWLSQVNVQLKKNYIILSFNAQVWTILWSVCPVYLINCNVIASGLMSTEETTIWYENYQGRALDRTEPRKQTRK